ncbi:MAG: threonine ammonia-lyase [Firmicutes bacterium]|nr:threonine ammonia-lyase [Bacillota bacterium]
MTPAGGRETGVSLEDVRRAAARISDVVRRTPLWPSRALSELAGTEVLLKMENLQRTGSFKIRGALNKVRAMRRCEREKGVVAASAGNHGQGVALAAAMAGTKATVVMPSASAVSKVKATRCYGAEVVMAGRDYDEAFGRALQICRESDATLVHAFDDPLVIAGQGTAGLEIVEELDGPFTLVCAIGGGGLAAGLAVAVKESVPEAGVIGVQAEGAPAFLRSMAAGERVSTGRVHTIADGIAVGTPGRLPLDIAGRYVDDVVSVTDDEIAAAILLLLERGKVLVEGAGAAPAAAVLSGKVRSRKGPLVLFLSWGNLDPSLLSGVISRGLVRSGRLFRWVLELEDRPGALAGVLRILADFGVNVVAVDHDRVRSGLQVGRVAVTISVETRDSAHATVALGALAAAGLDVGQPNGG